MYCNYYILEKTFGIFIHSLGNMGIKPSRHLPAKSQQSKHQKKVWNMFKVNNKDTKTLFSSVSIVNFEHVIDDW